MVVGTVIVASCGSDEVVEVPEYLRGDPTCMWIIGTYGHFADGSKRLIFIEDSHMTGAACVCMTDAEYESKSRVDELSDMALEVCEELAKQHPFEWNECQEDHDAGEENEWLMVRSAGEYVHPSGTALGCIGE